MHLTVILGSPNYTVRFLISFAKLQLGNKKERSSLVINCHHKDHCAKSNSQRKKRQPWERSSRPAAQAAGWPCRLGRGPQWHQGSPRLSPPFQPSPGRPPLCKHRASSSKRLALLSPRHRGSPPAPVITGAARGGERGGKAAVRVKIKREEGGVPALVQLLAFVIRVLRRRWGLSALGPGAASHALRPLSRVRMGMPPPSW